MLGHSHLCDAGECARLRRAKILQLPEIRRSLDGEDGRCISRCCSISLRIFGGVQLASSAIGGMVGFASHPDRLLPSSAQAERHTTSSPAFRASRAPIALPPDRGTKGRLSALPMPLRNDVVVTGTILSEIRRWLSALCFKPCRRKACLPDHPPALKSQRRHVGLCEICATGPRTSRSVTV